MNSFAFPSRPFDADTLKFNVPMLTQGELANLAQQAGVAYDSMRATMMVQVVDCNGQALSGAMVTVGPASAQGIPRYVANGRPDPLAMATDGWGLVFVFNSTQSAPAS